MGTTYALGTGIDGAANSVIAVVTVLNQLATMGHVADVVGTGHSI
jgi:hypothetical protein